VISKEIILEILAVSLIYFSRVQFSFHRRSFKTILGEITHEKSPWAGTFCCYFKLFSGRMEHHCITCLLGLELLSSIARPFDLLRKAVYAVLKR